MFGICEKYVEGYCIPFNPSKPKLLWCNMLIKYAPNNITQTIEDYANHEIMLISTPLVLSSNSSIIYIFNRWRMYRVIIFTPLVLSSNTSIIYLFNRWRMYRVIISMFRIELFVNKNLSCYC